ncbi:unnamed protein product, partial [marine sediment metagenome]
INPNPNIIQNEKEKAVFITIGLLMTLDIIPETKITL